MQKYDLFSSALAGGINTCRGILIKEPGARQPERAHVSSHGPIVTQLVHLYAKQASLQRINLWVTEVGCKLSSFNDGSTCATRRFVHGLGMKLI